MNNAKWFQKLFYKESILAIKSSLNFLAYESFKNDLILQLPQESQKSKTRIANNILHRFFPDKKIFIPMAQIWDVYKDEQLLQEIFRYDFLTNEPTIANFLTDYILTKEPESIIPAEVFNDYIKAYLLLFLVLVLFLKLKRLKLQQYGF